MWHNAFPDVDYDDFKKITGSSVTPALTPFVTGSYGLFTPQGTPIVGEISVFDISLSYENPATLIPRPARRRRPVITDSAISGAFIRN